MKVRHRDKEYKVSNVILCDWGNQVAIGFKTKEVLDEIVIKAIELDSKGVENE